MGVNMINITIQSKVHVAGTLAALGTLYSSVSAVFAEYVDNALDAGATNIWIELYPDRIVITDNGTGMLPDILPSDQLILAQFSQGKLKGDDDVRTLVDPIALSSLRWMVEFAALSPKGHKNDRNIRGTKGIGAIAFRFLGGKAVWRTRPNLELSQKFWRSQLKNRPTFKLEVPTNSQLQSGDTTNVISESTQMLTSPDGNQLDSGTSVEITKLLDDETIKPLALVDFLSGRFGNSIRSGVKLIVVDRVSEKGKKTNGINIEVQAPSYDGILIADMTAYVKSGNLMPFEVKIWYNPRAKNQIPQILRKGEMVGDVTNIAQLDCEPWNSGFLTGYIAFPDLVTDAEAPWNPTKTFPLPSPITNKWLNSISHVASEITAKIQEMEANRKEAEDRLRAKRIANAIEAAMQDLPGFRSLTLLHPVAKKPKQKSSGKQTKKKEDLRSMATVVDQFGRGVRGVVVEIRKDGQLSASLVTGLSGTVTFGVLENARYTVSLPDETRECTPKKHAFTIDKVVKKVRIEFRVQTNLKPPDDKRIRGITLWIRDLGDPMVPYSIKHLQTLGRVEINSKSFDYMAAVDTGDEDKQALLECMYTAMAVTEYAYPDESLEFCFASMSLLFSKAYSNVLASKPKRKPNRSHSVKRRKD